jgi:hypothetical protein
MVKEFIKNTKTKIIKDKEAKQKIGSLFLMALLVTATLTGMFVIGPFSPDIVRADPSDPWFDTDWNYRKEINVNYSQVLSTLTNFPVLINITDTGLRDNALSNGSDILFTNITGTQLNHEIELFNGTTGQLVAWVNVTSLSHSTDTTIYMYYGNSGASNQENVAGTWDDNYVAVYHMNDNTTSSILDSTSNNNDGTKKRANEPNEVTGQIGKAQDFDGSDDYLLLNHDFNTGFSDGIGFSNANMYMSAIVNGTFTYINHSSYYDISKCFVSGTDTYTRGDAQGEVGGAFFGSVLTPDGKVIFVPFKSDYVGIYDPDTDTYTRGDDHGEVDCAFYGGVLTPDGKVIFVPFHSNYVGIYDPDTDTYTRGDAQGEGGDDAFAGGVLTPDGKVIFVPFKSDYVGIYDPDTDTYTRGDAHGEVNVAFFGGVLTPDGKVIFVPYTSDYVGIYDPDTDTYTRGDDHGEVDLAFYGGVLTPDGKVIFVPRNSDYVGIYDPDTDTYTRGDAHGEVDLAFFGGVLTPDGKVIFVPRDSDYVGIYGDDYYFNGTIDELRISNIARSEDWIKTEYNNIVNATDGGFFSLGSQETKAGEGNAPTNSNPSPSDGATCVNYNPTLNITVNDPDGNTMNQTFWTNASGTWQAIGWYNNTGNASVENPTTVFTDCNTKYWWSSNVTDEHGNWDNDTYSFTTKGELVNSNPVPADTATDQELNTTINITVTTTCGCTMNQTFYTNSSGAWLPFAWNNNTANATLSNSSGTNFNSYSTQYWWSSNVSNSDGCWDNDTYSFTTKADPADEGWGEWSDTWTISADHNSTSTGYLYGNWTHSEHFAEGLGPEGYDELWTYTNASHWTVADHSSWWAGNATFEVDTSLTPHTFAILNDSGMNRSQSSGWIHLNETEYAPIFPYIIFAYNNSQDFYCIAIEEGDKMFIDKGAWLLHWNGTNMTNLNGTPVFDPRIDSENLVYQGWEEESDMRLPDGSWYKLIYNSKSSYLDFKWWSDYLDNMIMSEPIGWAVSENNETLVLDDPMSYGVGVWNPYRANTTIQFDFINLWQINRTVNTSATCTINGSTFDRPHMNFPTYNLTENAEEFEEFYNATGNITIDTIRDIMKDLTNKQNLEAISGYGDQFDYIYYYSALFDDVQAFLNEYGEGAPSWVYDEYLYIHVQAAVQSELSDGFAITVGIDVDDDGTWDDNDRLFNAYYDSFFDEVDRYQYNGYGFFWVEPNFNATIWETPQSGVANLHRYNTHLNYQIMIPLAELVKEDGHPINASDIFGLSITTDVDYDPVSFEYLSYTWQDWNETTEDTYYPAEDSPFYYFYDLEGPNPNVSAFGEGMILGDFEASGELSYGADVDVETDPDSVPGENEYAEYAEIEYTVNVTNTGTGDITNVMANMTWHSCACSDYNWTIVSYSEPIGNIDWYNNSCYWTITNASIGPAETWSIVFTINVTMCSGENLSGTMPFNVTVTMDESGATEYEGEGPIVLGALTETIRITYYVVGSDLMPILQAAMIMVMLLAIVITAGIMLKKISGKDDNEE